MPSESSESEGMVRVAFLDTAKKCFVYDSMTKEMVICDEEDTVLVRDSEEVLASSLSSYAPVDSSFLPVGALQTAGLGGFICAYKEPIGLFAAFVGLGSLLSTGGMLAGAGGTAVTAGSIGVIVIGGVIVVGAGITFVLVCDNFIEGITQRGSFNSARK